MGGFIEVEPLCTAKVLKFGVTPLAFLMTLFANIKILQYANVETFIMIRTSTPIATSLLDYVFLGRELPGLRSVGALLLAFIGSLAYVLLMLSGSWRRTLGVLYGLCYFFLTRSTLSTLSVLSK